MESLFELKYEKTNHDNAASRTVDHTVTEKRGERRHDKQNQLAQRHQGKHKNENEVWKEHASTPLVSEGAPYWHS